MAKRITSDERENHPVKLIVPLDASNIEDLEAGQKVRVAARNAAGEIRSTVVRIEKDGKATAEFSFKKVPGDLTIVLGPEDVSEKEIFGLQTISLTVSAHQWENAKELKLPWVVISPFYWYWWLRWCRTFTIRGRVLCANNNPVPGATVCAYDVNWFWWWISKHQVGCAVTDANGAFEIKFRWCCGWWPWWWWRIRRWELDQDLWNRIRHKYYQAGPYPPIPLPDPEPGLDIFRSILGEQEFASLNIQPKAFTVQDVRGSKEMVSPAPNAPAMDYTVLDALREKIIAKFPVSPELERFRIWPWWPWHPWSDCTPDIIFRATQNCNGSTSVIVDETFMDTRWDIPTSLNVTLHANDKACCTAPQDPDPAGTCVLLTDVCYTSVDHIGGNPGAALTPEGYAYPGIPANNGDRPFAGNVLIKGHMGNDVPYYSFEYSVNHGFSWQDLPTSAIGDFYREYWDPGPNIFTYVTFLHIIDGRMVFESRQHFEATHDPWKWGSTRWWMDLNYLGLMNWLTRTPFLNGDYQLRVKGWTLDGGGHLVPANTGQPLNKCSTTDVDILKLHIDNQTVYSPPPVTPPVCGPGTVHLCTDEPDSDIISVKIIHADGVIEDLQACGTNENKVKKDDKVQIDFRAHDPRGHLSYYTLHANYGENLTRDILALGSVPALLSGDNAGPNYPTALAALPPHNITPPYWYGGNFRISLNAQDVFPETCCYQVELYVHKRNIVDCDYSLWGYYNLSQYQITVIVDY